MKVITQGLWIVMFALGVCFLVLAPEQSKAQFNQRLLQPVLELPVAEDASGLKVESAAAVVPRQSSKSQRWVF